MLRPRIIPCLLIQKKGLVKTIRFSKPRYVGDPINAVRIFNEKSVDELMVLDIDATAEGREPDYGLIAKLAEECRMPLCYGGGVKTREQAEKIIALGVEKIAISSAALENPQLIADIAERLGNQSVVVVLDVKRNILNSRYEIRTCNGKIKTGQDPAGFVSKILSYGAGEIVINSIDRDGTGKGYDMALVSEIKKICTVPLTVLGGAGSLEDLGSLIERFGIIGTAAGSLFVFKGAYKAVLINYPNSTDKDNLIAKYYNNIQNV